MDPSLWWQCVRANLSFSLPTAAADSPSLFQVGVLQDQPRFTCPFISKDKSGGDEGCDLLLALLTPNVDTRCEAIVRLAMKDLALLAVEWICLHQECRMSPLDSADEVAKRQQYQCSKKKVP